ncbi:MAG: hypothetical protein QOE82_1401 [Thermoanaerobaculia bacterium]|jgi:hypothetical protein|nr:hypothetical protein [Thermoanaerobaculia bacterium]
MTIKTNARLAGFAYLLYIAAAFPSMVLFERATKGHGVAAKLASIAAHATDLRIAVILELVGVLCALVLAVTLYAVTRREDADVALMAFACRVVEGVSGALGVKGSAKLLWLATATGAKAPDAETVRILGATLLTGEGVGVTATFFAIGSTLFAWLLLRGRMIPAPLAWLGVLGSALLVVALPLQFVGVIPASGFGLIWLPVALFELTLGPWLIFKGVKETV